MRKVARRKPFSSLCCLHLLSLRMEEERRSFFHMRIMGLSLKDMGNIVWKKEVCPECGHKVKMPHIRKSAFYKFADLLADDTRYKAGLTNIKTYAKMKLRRRRGNGGVYAYRT